MSNHNNHESEDDASDKLRIQSRRILFVPHISNPTYEVEEVEGFCSFSTKREMDCLISRLVMVVVLSSRLFEKRSWVMQLSCY
jgi:hypothetical protein